MWRTKLRGSIGVAMLVASLATPARADDANADARAAFRQATAHVEKAEWAEALAAFERADKLSPHAVTTYNIGACERALGRYTRAKATLERALAQSDATTPRQLPDDLVTEARGFLESIDRALARVTLRLDPAGAALAIDGRPLQRSGDAWIAGTRAPGPGEPAPDGAFVVLMDPGAHVLTVQRKGYADAVVNRTFAPGARTEIVLSLDHLPATLHVTSSVAGAVVRVGDMDVGATPVDISRPPGNYRVVVRSAGRVPFETVVALRAGEEVSLRAPLPAETPSLTQRWWFWTAAGVVVTGAAVGTYFATRPAPSRPDVPSGTLGWKVNIP